MGGVAVQSIPSDEEEKEQIQQQRKRYQKFFVATEQTSRGVTHDDYGQFSGPPRRLTLPFSVETHTKNATGYVNPGGLLRRARLNSDSHIKQHRYPVLAGIVAEDTEFAETPVSSISSDSSQSARREWISAFDTAIMAVIRPQAVELRQQDMLAHTLIEDITQQVTLILPVIARDTEKEEQLNQHRDITATARGAGIAGFANLMYNALRYVMNVAMTHIVSPGIFGVFGEVITVVSLLGVLANLGFDRLLIYLLPTYRVKHDRDLANGLVRFSIRISLIAGFLLGALLFAFAPVIARAYYHAPSDELILRELALLIPLIALGGVFSAGLQALKEIEWKVYVQLSLSLITLIALVIFFLLGWGLEALIFSAISGYICSMLIGQIAFSKFVKRFTGDAAPRYLPRQWFGFALPALFSEQIFNIAITADILILSIFATPAQAGIYIIASRISSLVNLPLASLNVIFIPQMAEYFASGERKQLESMFKMVTKWSFSLSLPVCLCCLVFYDAILGIFGAQYTTGWLVLVILCFGYLANTGTGAVFQLLSIMRRLYITSIDSITQLILSIGLSFLLVPSLNILGAAMAVALASILVNVLCVIEVYWIMKLHPYRWNMCKPLLAGGVATIVGILLKHFVHLQPGSGRFAILVELGLIVPFILVYILVLLLLRFSEEDRIVFNALFVRFRRLRLTKRKRKQHDRV
jgi:O-antigen/teichoic acid export membrane protein